MPFGPSTCDMAGYQAKKLIGNLDGHMYPITLRLGCLSNWYSANPKKDDRSIEELEEYAESLRRDIDRLELQHAILEGTVELPGKDRSVDPGMLTNR